MPVVSNVLRNHRNLFLVDGMGALLSAFLLGVVLVGLEEVFGMPRSTLYFLAAIPCLFALYDFYCFFYVRDLRGWYLKLIGVSNLIYCVLSAGAVFMHWSEITIWGVIYVVVELLVVSFLGWIEIMAGKNLEI